MPCRPGWPWKWRSSCLCLPKLGLKASPTTPTLEIIFHGLSQYWNPVVVVPVSELCLCASVLSHWLSFSFVFHAVLLRLDCFVLFKKNDTCMHMRHGVLVEVKQLAWSGSLLPSRSWGLNSVISLDPQAWQQVLLPCSAISLAPRMPFNFL